MKTLILGGFFFKSCDVIKVAIVHRQFSQISIQENMRVKNISHLYIFFGYLLELRLESFLFFENSTTKKTQFFFAKLEKKLILKFFITKKEKNTEQ